MSKHDISFLETKMIKLILDNTLNELAIAEKTAKTATFRLEYNEREKILNYYKTLKQLILELQNANSVQDMYIALNKFLCGKQQTNEEENIVKLKNNTSSRHFQVSKLEMADQHVHNFQELQSQNHQLGKLKDKYQDELRNQSIILYYVTEWTESRTEQFRIQCFQKEENLIKQLKQHQTDIEKEHLMHEELESFYSMKLGEYIQQLVDWVDKYERHKNDYDEKIANIRNAHETLFEKIAEDKQIYASRQAEIKAYEELKEKRRLELMHLAVINEKATKIQAWWKGMMVRCKLGPYKIKKGKSKGKSKVK